MTSPLPFASGCPCTDHFPYPMGEGPFSCRVPLQLIASEAPEAGQADRTPLPRRCRDDGCRNGCGLSEGPSRGHEQQRRFQQGGDRGVSFRAVWGRPAGSPGHLRVPNEARPWQTESWCVSTVSKTARPRRSSFLLPIPCLLAARLVTRQLVS